MPLREPRHLLPGAAAFAAALLVALLGLNAGADEPAAPPDDGTVELQLLGVNDLHGHLEPPERTWTGPPSRIPTARSPCTPAT